MGCISVNPVVDGLEEELAGQLEVIRIDVQSETGKELASEYGPIYTPTFILFDKDGNQVGRYISQLDRNLIISFVETQ